MKKTILLLISFIFVFGIFLIAPVASEEADYYYINVPILKIFPYKLGYYIIYRRSGLQTGEAYIPQPWFAIKDQRATLSLINGQIEPYMSIVLNNGEFDHVRIVASKKLTHPTWGNISPGLDLSEKFKVEKLALEF